MNLAPGKVDGFVLVHGGCHGSWCWERLVPLLDRPTLAVDLPGRDSSEPGFDQLTLDDWVAALVEAVESFEPPRLAFVAHSLGGISMPAAAAKLADRAAALVFIAALIPKEGECALDAMQVGVEVLAPDGRFHVPPPEAARASLCNDMDETQAAAVLSRLNDEPGLPFRSPASRAGLPAVRTIYVRPTLDQGVPWGRQAHMIANLGEAEVMSVEAGHNVILSRPELIADVLAGV